MFFSKNITVVNELPFKIPENVHEKLTSSGYRIEVYDQQNKKHNHEYLNCLTKLFNQEFYHTDGERPDKDDFWIDIQKNVFTLILVKNNQLVGFAKFTIILDEQASIDHNKKQKLNLFYLDRIAIESQERGSGVGSALYAVILSIANDLHNNVKFNLSYLILYAINNSSDFYLKGKECNEVFFTSDNILYANMLGSLPIDQERITQRLSRFNNSSRSLSESIKNDIKKPELEPYLNFTNDPLPQLFDQLDTSSLEEFSFLTNEISQPEENENSSYLSRPFKKRKLFNTFTTK